MGFRAGEHQSRALTNCRFASAVVGLLISGLFVLALASTPAQAHVVHVDGQTYGVFFKPSHASALAVTPAKGESQPPLVSGGGPLMLTSKFYAIFWGPKGSFAASYENSIVQYLKDLQADSGKLTNDYSVSAQYTDSSHRAITTNNTFATSFDDTQGYPAAIGPCKSDPNQGNPCVTDAGIQTEIQRLIAKKGWQTDDSASPVAQYLLFTPKNTDSCFDKGPCTFSSSGAFCGYHSEITTVNGTSKIAIYSNLPYAPGCDSGNAPAGVSGDVDADGTLDTLAHELGESATDPENGTGYTDSSGNEIGDKCQNGPINNDMPLGGSATASPPTLYNQVINGHQYYTQTLWSNAPTKTPSSTTAAGCLQRFGPTPAFVAPNGVSAGHPQAFDGSNSYDAASTISSYVWNFGDGTGNVSGANASHTFAAAGTYAVTLTVSDSTGAGNASTRTAMISVSPGAATAAPFSTLAAPFTQKLYATGFPFAFGIAFAGNGDVFASFGALQRVDSHSTIAQSGSTIHPTSTVSPGVSVGLGLVNGVNGDVYANTGSGVQPLDPTTGQPIGSPIGPAGNQLGITVDPQTGNLVYGSNAGISFVSPDGTKTGTFTSSVSPDGIVFDPTGNYLFAASGGGVAVINRSGTVVQSIALTTPGSSGSDGMAFHAGTPNFLISNNNSGDLTRFDFPVGDYTKVPKQSVFASGGSRGDLTQVGSDGCLYVSQESTKFADGTTGSAGSIVQICPGFIPPVVVAAPTTLVANGYAFNFVPGFTFYATPSATLTSAGKGVSGQTITFTAGGKTICTAKTDATGLAKCSGRFPGLQAVITAGGYQATFAGTPAYKPSQATGGLISINHIPFLKSPAPSTPAQPGSSTAQPTPQTTSTATPPLKPSRTTGDPMAPILNGADWLRLNPTNHQTARRGRLKRTHARVSRGLRK